MATPRFGHDEALGYPEEIADDEKAPDYVRKLALTLIVIKQDMERIERIASQASRKADDFGGFAEAPG